MSAQADGTRRPHVGRFLPNGLDLTVAVARRLVASIGRDGVEPAEERLAFVGVLPREPQCPPSQEGSSPMQLDVHPTRFAYGRRGRSRAWLAAPVAALVAALAVSAPADAASATPVGTVSYASVQGPVVLSEGLIMRDGGICDPIRHIGC